eukprot:76805_1
MNTGICPLHNEYNEPLEWTFTEALGTCIYNVYDQSSFIIGWIAVVIWTFALLPQIITNFKNKAAESQSFWFWLLWVIGDFCNLTGCILTKNLITNVALALVYLLFTAFAFVQWIWYEYILAKRKKNVFSSISMSPKLIKTLKLLSKSPRKLSVSYQLSEDMRTEYDAIQAQKFNQEQHLFSEDTDNECQDNNCITPHSHNKSIKIYEDYDTNLEPLRSSNTTRYGSISTVLSTLSMSITVVMLYGINTNHNSYEHNYGNSQRILLSEIEITSNDQIQVLMMLGMLLGWTSCLIYASSRIPQLKLMLNTKDVSGINPMFFGLTFAGNLAQCLSMLINKQIYQYSHDLYSKLPWLLTAAVCMIQDGTILFLIYLYKSNRYKTLSDINSYSKVFMVKSPHYLVTNEEYNHRKRTKSCDTFDDQYLYNERKYSCNDNLFIVTNTV